MSVRRVARAADDGFASELVMGLHATADAERLASDIGRAVAQLKDLRTAPPAWATGEEGLWRAFLIGVVAGDPRADAELPTWQSGELPADGHAASPDMVAAYRAWAQRAGGQAVALAGEASWTPQRRFERAFERLALPGFGRSPRYAYLRLAGTLGLADLTPSSLQVAADPRDPVVIAAKRVFGIGDALLIERRAGELARACGVGLGELELALRYWGDTDAEPADTAVDPDAEGQAHAALGLSTDEPDEGDVDGPGEGDVDGPGEPSPASG